MKKIERASIVLAVIGILVATLLVGGYGFEPVMRATFSAGLRGFALLCLWQGVLFAVNGVAWNTVMPGRGARRLLVMLWGRMVRDAAGNCLPFSQLGGFLLGVRAVTIHGIGWSIATASTVVDVTAEFIAQIAFGLFGLTLFLLRDPRAVLAPGMVAGIALAIATAIAFIWLQRGGGGLFRRLGERIGGRGLGLANGRLADLGHDLSLIHAGSGRVAACVALHVLGWLGTATGAWIAFRLLGAPIDMAAAIAIEGLLHAVLATAFLVPGYAGVQEAGYVALGALYGIPPEICLGVSLLRRGRDIAVGVPILLAWQSFELRRLRPRRENARVADSALDPGNG